MPTKALVVCPGRGSYSRDSLGYLAGRSSEAQAVIDACDAYRAAHGRTPLRELDGAERYQSKQHVFGENASLLTFACSMADFSELSDRYEVVGVAGNSMGFYTALAASGALPLDDAIRLVDTMGAYQKGNVIGGQVLYPLVGDDWRLDPKLQQHLDAVLAQIASEGHVAEVSIELGGYAVIGADTSAIPRLKELLEPQTKGPRTFPLQLPFHSAFHTSLLAETAVRAQAELADLRFRAPRVPLIDGRGYVFRPRWAEPDALFSYTLGHQVERTYEFTKSIRTALQHTGAEVIVVLGPGNSLGGPIARALVWEGFRGIQEKVDLEGRQLIRSFGVPEQRALLR